MPRLAQSFALAAPPDALWRELHDLEMVARCMPGVTLDGAPEDGRVKGALGLKLGPIRTSFAGTAEVAMDEPTHTGVVRGQALDRKNNSRARSEIQFRVEPEGAGSRVGVVVDFTLSGTLAQFSRGAIVEEVGQKLTDQFAKNLDTTIAARLAPVARAASGADETQSAAAPVAKDASIGVFRLLWAAFVSWLRRKFSAGAAEKGPHS